MGLVAFLSFTDFVVEAVVSQKRCFKGNSFSGMQNFGSFQQGTGISSEVDGEFTSCNGFGITVAVRTLRVDALLFLLLLRSSRRSLTSHL